MKSINHFCYSTFIIGIIAFITAQSASAQSINSRWKQELNSDMEKFMKCQSSEEAKNACTNFIGESVKRVYNLDDFYLPAQGRYLRAGEIHSYLSETKKWTLIGKCYDQKTLEAAQQHANANKAVVAVYMDASGLGHVVLIVPGELTTSGSWGLKVPNAVSFPVTDPQKSFVDKGLSFAFTKNMMKDVHIYVRKY
jgi:hypothetical protein